VRGAFGARKHEHRRKGKQDRCQDCRRPPIAMSEDERDEPIRWWLYESGLEVDDLLELAIVDRGLAVGLGLEALQGVTTMGSTATRTASPARRREA
jgi:hypothetical protein